MASKMNAYTQTLANTYVGEADEVLQPLIVKLEKLENEWKIRKSKMDEKLKAKGDQSGTKKPFRLNWNEFPYKVHIGPNGTELSKKMYLRVDFSSYHDTTRDLCYMIFGREVLGTHTVTGKFGPGTVNNNMKAKGKLDPAIVQDIVYHVKAIFKVPERQILHYIRLSCRNSARSLQEKQKRAK